MPRYATVRELKNQTTALVREAEEAGPIVVTRRGKPVATLRRFREKDLQGGKRYPTTAFDSLRRKILTKHPDLARQTEEETHAEFERISAKVRRSPPFKDWRAMDRFLKGDRLGLSR